jgi:hypothetical protein
VQLVHSMELIEGEMRNLTDIAVTLARYDKRTLAMTTRISLMDKRWDELRQEEADVCRVG